MTAYKNLGMLYYNLGDFRPALNYYIRAKDILEKHPKNQQLELAQIYINIGEILYSLEEYSESVAYFSNAFTIRLKELGQESELTQQALNYSLIAFDSAPKYLMKVDGTIIETKDVEITV